ncbi:MAG: hypothetical protein PVG66_10190 [Chromatiales bacterium]|jgi:hypothetical protein
MYEKLEKLVGKQFVFNGCVWLLIEILPEMDSLVLRRQDDSKRIQGDQFGAPTRKCSETLTLQISNEDGSEFSAELTRLLAGKI